MTRPNTIQDRQKYHHPLSEYCRLDGVSLETYCGPLDEARAYLEILDPTEQHHVFQTFLDVRWSEATGSRRVIGTFADHADQLVDLNRQERLGVFVTMGRTNLKGRRVKDMVEPRAVWCDLDKGGLDALRRLPLPPSIVVETSPDKFHAIYTVQGLSWDQFDGIMRRMVFDWGCDPNAIDKSRVLRLPGFLHQKGQPFRSRLVRELMTGEAYSAEHLLDVFPPIAAPEPTPSATDGAHKSWDGTREGADKIVAALRFIEQTALDKGGTHTVHDTSNPNNRPFTIDWADRTFWLKMGFGLHHFFGGHELGFDIWCAASTGNEGHGLVGCPTKFDAHDQRKTWDSFADPEVVQSRPGQMITVGTLLWAARMCGWASNRRPKPQRHPSVQSVFDAAPAVLQPGFMEAFQAKVCAMYDRSLLRQIKLLAENIDKTRGYAQIPSIEQAAQLVEVKPVTLRKNMKRLVADGLLIVSNGNGVGITGKKGIAYTLALPDFEVSAPQVQATSTHEAKPSAPIIEDFSPFVRQGLMRYGTGGGSIPAIDLWIGQDIMSETLVESIKFAREAGVRANTKTPIWDKIAREFWAWLTPGRPRAAFVEAIEYCEAASLRAARKKLRAEGKISPTDDAVISMLTPGQHLNLFLNELSHWSRNHGIKSKGASDIDAIYARAAKRRAQEETRAKVEFDARVQLFKDVRDGLVSLDGEVSG